MSIAVNPVDVELGEDWIYALAEVDGEAVAHADGATSSFRAKKGWLLRREPSGEWLLARHVWNTRPQ